MISRSIDDDYQIRFYKDQIEVMDDEMDLLIKEYDKTGEQWKDGYLGIISGIRQNQEKLKEKLHYLMFGEY